MTQFFIGTSGWSYGHWRGNFYPHDLPSNQFFNFYSKKFNTVEINSSFYHLPRESTFEKWYNQSPKNFLFAVKGSKFISHQKRLIDCQEPWELFYSRAKVLGKKLVPILFQFPPSFKANLERLENFLKILPGKEQFAFEFRHQSWFTSSTYQILEKYNMALVMADTPCYPYEEEITANFTYLRLHGHERLYASNYSDDFLKQLAKKIKHWSKEYKLRQVYVYFDNDFGGNACKNALSLRRFLEKLNI